MVTNSLKTVLIVDDDPGIREALTEFLQEMGFQVWGAAHGREAMSLLRGGIRPGLILLDLMMPEMSGQEFREAQLAEPALAGIPVAILSAGHDLRTIATQLDAIAWFRKPPHLDELLELIDAHTTSSPDRN